MFTKYEYTKSWLNPSDFPTVETDETQVRKDLQCLHDETKLAIWALIDALSSEDGAAGIGTTEGTNLQQIVTQLLQTAHEHDDTEELERICDAFRGFSVTETLTDDSTLIPTAKAVLDQMKTSGMADMLRSVYDPTGKMCDIFAYADNAAADRAPLEHDHDDKAPLYHNHSASDLTGGILPLKYGGTGGATADEARYNLKAAASSHSHAAGDITSGFIPLNRGGTGTSVSMVNAPANAIIKKDSVGTHLYYTPTANGAFYATSSGGVAKFGTLPIAQGGTGATSAAAARTNLEVAPAKPSTSSSYSNCYWRTVDSMVEWINPPLVLGTEYRTSERWNNKPVYTKLVDCGTVTNGTTVTFTEESIHTIRFAGFTLAGALPILLEDHFSGNWKLWCFVKDNEVEIYMGSMYPSGERVYIQVWYIKS